MRQIPAQVWYDVSMENKNELLLGWPPFDKFKREMVNLTEEVTNPIKKDLAQVKESIFSYIQKSDKSFEDIKHILSNHITDTNKKIDALSEKTNKKIDALSEKVDKILNSIQKS